MSWSDALILPGFELCTFIETNDIEKYAKDLAQGVNPKDIKMKLAYEIVKIYHGDKKAKDAEMSWENTFSKKEIPSDVLEIKVNKDDLFVDILLKNKIISSKGDFRRLADEGAITNLELNEKIKDIKYLAIPGTYKIGKKRFIKII